MSHHVFFLFFCEQITTTIASASNLRVVLQNAEIRECSDRRRPRARANRHAVPLGTASHILSRVSHARTHPCPTPKSPVDSKHDSVRGATNIQYPERIYHYQRADAIIATPTRRHRHRHAGECYAGGRRSKLGRYYQRPSTQGPRVPRCSSPAAAACLESR